MHRDYIDQTISHEIEIKYFDANIYYEGYEFITDSYVIYLATL